MVDYLLITKESLKWIIGVFGVYMASLFIHHFLDRVIKRGRIDNLILYRLTLKSPLASTRVILETNKIPEIKKIQEKIEKIFEKKGFDENKIISSSSYQFKLKKHPTLFRLRITEGDVKNPITITLETLSDDKIPFFFNGYFSKTISYFEEIINELKELELKTIAVSLRVSSLLGKTENISCTYQGNSIGTNVISIGDKNFTKIEPLVKECLRIWRNNFI